MKILIKFNKEFLIHRNLVPAMLYKEDMIPSKVQKIESWETYINFNIDHGFRILLDSNDIVLRFSKRNFKLVELSLWCYDLDFNRKVIHSTDAILYGVNWKMDFDSYEKLNKVNKPFKELCKPIDDE